MAPSYGTTPDTPLPDCRHSEAYAREVVYGRAGSKCERCRTAGKPLEWAHRLARGQGGPWCPTNGLHLCVDCHAWSHSHSEEAYRLGIRLRSTTDPHVAPVWLEVLGNEGWWALDPQGGYLAVEVSHATPRGLECRYCRQDIHIVNAERGPEWVHTGSGSILCQPRSAT